MNTELIIFFIILNVVNVIAQTVRSLATIKCGKGVAALVNALTYGLYTVVVVYTVCELPLWFKVAVVAFCNLVGVFVVKWGEEKARKDKLWEVRGTLTTPANWVAVCKDLDAANIPYNYIDVNKYIIFNCYCATQADSAKIKKILNDWEMKYFVSESKTL